MNRIIKFIAALRKLEEGDKTVTEERNDDGWICVFDELPKLGKDVELVCDKVSIREIQKEDININHLWAEDSGAYLWHIKNKGIACYWRYPKQKRPDFGKLREGDLIVVDGIYSGFIESIEDQYIGLGSFSETKKAIFIVSKKGSYHPKELLFIDKIKKITRLNLETREFEEI